MAIYYDQFTDINCGHDAYCANYNSSWTGGVELPRSVRAPDEACIVDNKEAEVEQ